MAEIIVLVDVVKIDFNIEEIEVDKTLGLNIKISMTAHFCFTKNFFFVLLLLLF